MDPDGYYFIYLGNLIKPLGRCCLWYIVLRNNYLATSERNFNRWSHGRMNDRVFDISTFNA